MKMMTRMTKISKSSQKARFIKAAREAECSEGEAEFDADLRRIVRPKELGGKKVSKERASSSDD